MSANFLLAVAAAMGAVVLATLAAAMLARAAEDRDLSTRMRTVIRPSERREAAGGASLAAGLLQPLRRLGDMLRNSAIVSERELTEFQRALAAAGMNSQRAIPVFLGAKVLAIVLLPTLALVSIPLFALETMQALYVVLGALVLAMMGPNWVLGHLRRPYVDQLRRGLPDALDLLVVAAEAGLALDSAVDRVGREMARGNRAIALELGILVQELRLLPDRSEALRRLGERTGLDGFRQLSTTLMQTMRFGTPLAQALRVLAAEMRTARQLRLEEKAIRLPALLIGPLILFILPTLFIALLTPAILELMRGMG